MFQLFKKKEPIDTSKMYLVIKSKDCPQNHPCPAMRFCPTGALSQSGFKAPKVNQNLCIKCGKCTKHCAYKAMKLIPKGSIL